MIYTLAGVPLNRHELTSIALAIAERKRTVHQPKPTLYALTKHGHRHYHIRHDRNGDPYRVFRALHRDRGKLGDMREHARRHGVGRPPGLR